MVLLMRTRAEEEALRRRAPGLRGLGEATAAYPGIEKVCVMLHVRYSSSFFFCVYPRRQMRARIREA